MGLAIGQHIGSYEVVSELGAGGMAVVYRARHRVLHSDHAIKVLDEKLARSKEIRQRFLSEARIQARLRHPHITPVTDVIAAPGVAAIVMPFLRGEDLRARLTRQGAAAVDDAVRWTLQVLDALAFVHEQGIIHRDLKPANLFLETQPGGREVVRVMDFGIARLADSTLTRTAMTMGTLHYMSPEQIQSPGSVDARSDLFSLGAVLYELLTGSLAFDAGTDFQIQMNIVSGSYTRCSAILPEQHAAIAAVVDRALSTTPHDRVGSAQALSQALRQAQEAGTRTTDEPPKSRFRKVVSYQVVGLDRSLPAELPLPPERDELLRLLLEAVADGAAEFFIMDGSDGSFFQVCPSDIDDSPLRAEYQRPVTGGVQHFSLCQPGSPGRRSLDLAAVLRHLVSYVETGAPAPDAVLEDITAELGLA